MRNLGKTLKTNSHEPQLDGSGRGVTVHLTACNTDVVPQGTVAYNPQQRTGEVAPEELFSSMEVITLQCPDEIIADTGNDLLFDAGIFYLVDRVHRKSVDLFDRQGGYIGSVRAFGRSGAEYADISGVQPVDSLVAVYSYHNQALCYYDRQGGFVRRDSLAYQPLSLLKDGDGYWGYAGYSNTVPSRVVRMDPQGRITREYLPTAKIIPLMEMNSVFVPHGEELFIREALQRRIFRIDAAGELSTFLTFDFGRWNIPDTYFESDDPMQAAQKLMSSDFALMNRFMINNDFTVAEVGFNPNSDNGTSFSSIGVGHRGAWRWLRADREGPRALFFSAARALTPDSELVLLTDAERLAALKEACPTLVPDFQADTDNTLVVLCRLKD